MARSVTLAVPSSTAPSLRRGRPRGRPPRRRGRRRAAGRARRSRSPRRRGAVPRRPSPRGVAASPSSVAERRRRPPPGSCGLVDDEPRRRRRRRPRRSRPSARRPGATPHAAASRKTIPNPSCSSPPHRERQGCAKTSAAPSRSTLSASLTRPRNAHVGARATSPRAAAGASRHGRRPRRRASSRADVGAHLATASMSTSIPLRGTSRPTETTRWPLGRAARVARAPSRAALGGERDEPRRVDAGRDLDDRRAGRRPRAGAPRPRGTSRRSRRPRRARARDRASARDRRAAARGSRPPRRAGRRRRGTPRRSPERARAGRRGRRARGPGGTRSTSRSIARRAAGVGTYSVRAATRSTTQPALGALLAS